MSWMCALLSDADNTNQSEIIPPGFNFTFITVDSNTSLSTEYDFTSSPWSGEEFIVQVVIPVVCAAGTLGNLVTCVVLFKRMQEGIEMLEKGSIVAMMGK